MKKILILIFAVFLVAGPVVADGPSPLDWQEQYFKQNKAVQARILNHDWEVANLENQIYDLQAINQGLREENQDLRSTPEIVYIEIEKGVETGPNWFLIVGSFLLGAFIR